MIAIIDNGEEWSRHTVYFVDVGATGKSTVEEWLDRKGAFEDEGYLIAFVPNDGVWWKKDELCAVADCDAFPFSIRHPEENGDG